jgi:hypothetical protein
MGLPFQSFSPHKDSHSFRSPYSHTVVSNRPTAWIGMFHSVAESYTLCEALSPKAAVKLRSRPVTLLGLCTSEVFHPSTPSLISQRLLFYTLLSVDENRYQYSIALGCRRVHSTLAGQATSLMFSALSPFHLFGKQLGISVFFCRKDRENITITTIATLHTQLPLLLSA